MTLAMFDPFGAIISSITLQYWGSVYPKAQAPLMYFLGLELKPCRNILASKTSLMVELHNLDEFHDSMSP